MKDYVNWIKFTWKHYVTILFVVLVFCIEDDYFYLKDFNVDMFFENELCKLDFVFQDKIMGDTMFHLGFIVIIMAVILLIRHLPFVNFTKIEFMNTLPVKKTAFYVMDYLLTFGIFVGAFVVDLVVYGIVQGNHNNALIVKQPELLNEAKLLNHQFIVAGIGYLIILFLAFNILYLGVTMGKNVVIGILAAICTWYFLIPLFLTFENENDVLYSLILGLILAVVNFGCVLKRNLKKGFWCYWVVLDYLVMAIVAVGVGFICDEVLDRWISIFVACCVGVAFVVFHEMGYKSRG